MIAKTDSQTAIRVVSIAIHVHIDNTIFIQHDVHGVPCPITSLVLQQPQVQDRSSTDQHQ